jgi:large subunit ribosomal protein L33
MPREYIILECTEAKAEGKPPSRYMSTRNKKVQTERVEKKKYNKFLRRHTLHREVKG